jgi:hypothetical protein
MKPAPRTRCTASNPPPPPHRRARDARGQCRAGALRSSPDHVRRFKRAHGPHRLDHPSSCPFPSRASQPQVVYAGEFCLQPPGLPPPSPEASPCAAAAAVRPQPTRASLHARHLPPGDHSPLPRTRSEWWRAHSRRCPAVPERLTNPAPVRASGARGRGRRCGAGRVESRQPNGRQRLRAADRQQLWWGRLGERALQSRALRSSRLRRMSCPASSACGAAPLRRHPLRLASHLCSARHDHSAPSQQLRNESLQAPLLALPLLHPARHLLSARGAAAPAQAAAGAQLRGPHRGGHGSQGPRPQAAARASALPRGWRVTWRDYRKRLGPCANAT